MEFWIEFVKYFFVATYIVWGGVVAFETILAMGGNEFAINWAKKRFRLKSFMIEIYAFYPLVLLTYLFLEIIPFYLGFSRSLTKFDISQAMYNIFKEEIDNEN